MTGLQQMLHKHEKDIPTKGISKTGEFEMQNRLIVEVGDGAILKICYMSSNLNHLTRQANHKHVIYYTQQQKISYYLYKPGGNIH